MLYDKVRGGFLFCSTYKFPDVNKTNFFGMLCCRSCHLIAARRSSTAQYFDVVVVGGGMVGNAMACVIGQNPEMSSKRVLLLDSGKAVTLAKKPPEYYSNRVSTVGPASVDLFKKLGIWERLLSYRTKKVNKFRIIDSCSRAELEFSQSAQGREIAYILENNAVVGALNDRIKESCSSVEIKNDVVVKNCTFPTNLLDLAVVELETGEKIETSLVVRINISLFNSFILHIFYLIGADGIRSMVRKSLCANYTAFDYDQCGVVATLVVEGCGVNDVAWQRFFRAGPIAYLPLTDKLSSLVWSTSTDEAQRLLALSKDQFVDKLNRCMFSDEDQIDCVNKTLFAFSKMPLIGKSSGPVLQPPYVVSLQEDTRAAFPLGFAHSHAYVGVRCALIGDAAHRIHPLAGQGVNLGWHDVALLDRVLSRAVSHGADLGALTYLREYDTQAQRHNVPVMVLCDWLNRLYRTNAAPIVMLRSLGLSAFDRLTIVKDFLVNKLSTLP
ncbi:putative ubiquinone biosynthesis monooxygenase COQ6 [Dictyocaulus viviparus]|uniref:Ubiquinone biosynthesis monooxygenase COQ6, mitochondrial n=1 Tax=Dictyocaulus viviparus TaxID=29172 RepID=A0A0D8YFH5_DICVI|nr:putative ubiquinone biosynthesis monooxygenase COQ6 [Dictyocaulus viviparus]